MVTNTKLYKLSESEWWRGGALSGYALSANCIGWWLSKQSKVTSSKQRTHTQNSEQRTEIWC